MDAKIVPPFGGLMEADETEMEAEIGSLSKTYGKSCWTATSQNTTR